MAILRCQKTNFDCGPTCFANALNLLGYDIKINQANRLCNLTRDGTNSGDLMRAFDRYGFEASERIHYNPERAWEWLISDSKRGLPAIISVDQDEHWMLVLLAGSEHAQIFDPEHSVPTLIDKADLLDRWIYVRKAKQNRLHGLSLKPLKEKAIRAAYIRSRLIATADFK